MIYLLVEFNDKICFQIIHKNIHNQIDFNFHMNQTVIILYILINTVKHSLCFGWRNWWSLYLPKPDMVAPRQCCTWRKVPKEHLDWIHSNISMSSSKTTSRKQRQICGNKKQKIISSKRSLHISGEIFLGVIFSLWI